MEIHLKFHKSTLWQFFRLDKNNWRIWAFFLVINITLT
jgi:hypothetical protein